MVYDSDLPEHQITNGVGFLRIKQILHVIPVGRSTWWQWVAEGKAPKPVKLAPRITVWRAADIKALIERLDQNPSQNEKA